MNSPRRSETVLVLSFLVMLGTPAIVQSVIEWRRDGSVQAVSLFHTRPTSAHLRTYEEELEDASWLGRLLRPWVQYAQFTWLGDGGDKALLGREGWLFYKPGFRYLTERPAPATDDVDNTPLAAITGFRAQLAARGIQLLVVLAPNKESVYPEMLSRRASRTEMLLSPETHSLLRDLAHAGVEVVNLCEAYGEIKQDAAQAQTAPLYLRQDSHWSPAGVEVAARTVAQRILDLGWLSAGTTVYERRPVPVARLGDLVRMLQVPLIESTTKPEEILCQQIVCRDTQQRYEDDPAAQVLGLGDSFLRIYEQDEPGAAGFIAHLARELRQPLASAVNDGGASTWVRQGLYRRPTLLQHKRVVVWEFVDRDIRFGTEGWQQVPLP